MGNATRQCYRRNGLRVLAKRAMLLGVEAGVVLCLTAGPCATRAAADPFEGLSIQRCNLHVHTVFSYAPPPLGDGVDHADCSDPLAEAIGYFDCDHGGLDVVAFSDHAFKLGYVNQDPSGDLEWDLLGSASHTYNWYGPRLAMRGFEWTPECGFPWDAPDEIWEWVEGRGNHVNIFGTSDYCGARLGELDGYPYSIVPQLDYDPADPGAQYLYGWVLDHTSEAPICQFNHPWFNGCDEWPAHFNDFALPVRPEDQGVLDHFCLIEVAGGPEAGEIPSWLWHETVSSGESYYRSALRHGWRVAPSTGVDNMVAVDCSAREVHTGVWAPSPSAVPDAIRGRCTFASENPHLELKFWLDDGTTEHRMGWDGAPVEIGNSGGVHLSTREPASVQGPSAVLFMLGPGATVVLPWDAADLSTEDGLTVGAWDCTLTHAQLPADGAVLYARVETSSGDALSAPIWVRPRPVLSGTVHDEDGAGLPGVVMEGLPGSPSTDAYGRYSVLVPAGWSGTVSPYKADWAFLPDQTVYTDVQASESADYTATPLLPRVYGVVNRNDFTGVAGVVMDGLPGSPATDPDGYYMDTVPFGWSGTVTPQKPDWRFEPSSITLSNVEGDIEMPRCIAIPLYPTISGHVRTGEGAGVEGVAMTGLPDPLLTDYTGYYCAVVPYDWSGDVIPQKTGYEFEPWVLGYYYVKSDVSGADYTALPLQYSISGSVLTAEGAPIPGVIMAGLPDSPMTGGDGTYVGTVLYDWNGVVAPEKGGFAFEPPAIQYWSVKGSYAHQNYTGRALLPDLVVSELIAPSHAVLGTSVEVRETSANEGEAGCAAFVTRICLATDELLVDQIDYRDLPGHSGLSPGTAEERTGNLDVPSQPGLYYVGAIVDAGDEIDEGSGEWNNRRSQVLIVCDPLIAEAGADKLVACGGSTRLDGSATGGVPPHGYSWSPAAGLDDPSVAQPTASPSSTTVYTLRVTDDLGQTDADSVTVTVASEVVAEAGPDKVIGGGGSTALEGSASGGIAPYSYLWSPAAGLSDPGMAQPAASPTVTTTYTLTVTDDIGQTDTDSVTVTVEAGVVAEAGPDRAIGSGGSTTLEGSASGGVTPYSYVWSPSTGLDSTTVAQPTASPSSTTVYTLTVTDDIGQTDADTATVTVVPAPTADFTASPTIGFAPLRVTFTDASTNGPASWSWDFGDGTASTAQHPMHEYTDVGAYAVGLTASNEGGSDTETKPRYILVTFPDVPFEPEEYWALHQLLACVDAGIVQGYPGGNYGPTDPVTRGQMAVYTARANATPTGDEGVPDPEPGTQSFTDVDPTHWAYRYVEYCYASHIVKGYPAGAYRPDETVNRGQMAVYMARAVVTPTGDAAIPDPEPPYTFSDVPGEDSAWAWCHKHVEYLAGRSVVHGYADNTYRPANAVTRDQMAVYVARAFELPM